MSVTVCVCVCLSFCLSGNCLLAHFIILYGSTENDGPETDGSSGKA